MKIRVKINAVVEVEGDVLPSCNPLDLIEKGVSVLNATAIAPGGRVSLGRVRETRK